MTINTIAHFNNFDIYYDLQNQVYIKYQEPIMQKNKLSHKDVKRIMAHKLYKLEEITKSKENLKDLIDAINDQKICAETIKMIRMLIRFFRQPILIQFRPFYTKLQSSPQIFYLDSQIKIAASLVRFVIDLQMFPGLSFYTHAGFDSQVTVAQEFLMGQQKFKMDEFIKVTSFADQLIVSIIKDKPTLELDKIKFAKRQLIQHKQKCKIKDPLKQLCLEEYIRLLEQKEKIINKMLVPIKEMPQFQPQKREIYIENGKNPKKINDIKVAQDYLCCRPYFYYNQIIDQPQTLNQEYKNYTFPYNKFLNQTLLKTIVGFLNGKGGIIYIGIAQNNDSKKRLAKGFQYNEAKKQDVLKHFRLLCQRISPEIVNNQLYKLQYVPIKQQDGTFSPGKYIIRLKIQKGHWDDLYSFKNYDGEQLFAFRTANEVLLKSMNQQILQLYRRRLDQRDESRYQAHQGPCKIPDNGRPIYQKYQQQTFKNNNDIKINKNNYKARESSQKQSALEIFKKQHPFFIFNGDKFPPQMQAYKGFSGQFRFVQPKSFDQYKLIDAIIKKLQKPDQFQKCSFIMSFQEEYFHQISKNLTNAKILFVNHKNSRRHLIFSDLQEILNAIQLLRKQNIPIGFGQ